MNGVKRHLACILHQKGKTVSELQFSDPNEKEKATFSRKNNYVKRLVYLVSGLLNLNIHSNELSLLLVRECRVCKCTKTARKIR